MLRLVYGLIFLLATGEPVPCDVKRQRAGQCLLRGMACKGAKGPRDFRSCFRRQSRMPGNRRHGEAALAAAIRHLVHDENGQAVD